MLIGYAAGSPACRLDVAVHVLVVVKHITMAKLFLRTRISEDYSPAAQTESRKAFLDYKRGRHQLSKQKLPQILVDQGLNCTTPKAAPGIVGAVTDVLTALVVVSKISSVPPWIT